MNDTLLRDAIDLLLQEAFDGPPDPDTTWFVSNAPESGVLGTVRHLTVAQAWHKPKGLSHSAAEHVAHILYSLNHAMRDASDDESDADWERSFDAGRPSEANWASLQRHLRESHLRVRMWVHAEATFATKESVARVIGAIAHGAYHLGAIRQVAAIASRTMPEPDPVEAGLRPL